MERQTLSTVTERRSGGAASARTLWIIAVVTTGCATGGMIWLFYGGGSPGGQAGPDSPQTGQASRLAAVSGPESAEPVDETSSELAHTKAAGHSLQKAPETALPSDAPPADTMAAANPPEPEREEASRLEEPPAAPVAMQPAPEAAPVLPDVEPATTTAISVPAAVKPDPPAQPEAPATALQPEPVEPPESMAAPNEIQPEPTVMEPPAVAEPSAEAATTDLAPDPAPPPPSEGVGTVPDTKTEDASGAAIAEPPPSLPETGPAAPVAVAPEPVGQGTAPVMPERRRVPTAEALTVDAPAGSAAWPSWLQVGGDFRFRQTYSEADRLDRKARGHDSVFQRYRLRAWARILAAEDVDLNVRLVTEPRYYFRPDRDEQYINDEVLIDRLNITWRNVANLPLTAVLGRQDIELGSGWLVQRGTPLDGSRTTFFDAARLTWQIDERTTADLIYIENHANSSAWLHPLNDADVDFEEQDARGAIAYLSRTDGPRRMDGYFIYKRDHHPNRAGGGEGDIYTLGAMFADHLNEDWEMKVEVAPQFGHRNGKSLSSFATNNTLTLHLHDAVEGRLRLGYEYLSGDEDPDRHFDKLWGRTPQFSKLYNGPIDSIDGRTRDSSNLHRLSLGYVCRPRESVQWDADYHLLFADEHATPPGATGLSEHGMFRGQLLTTQLEIQSDKHLRHRVRAELFAPGNYYNDDRNDVAVFLRYELLFTW